MEGDIQERLVSGENESREENDLRSIIWRGIKSLWWLVGRTIFTRFWVSCLAVVRQAFVGNIGATELAAYTLVLTVLVNFAEGLLIGLTSELYNRCWKEYDAKRYEMLGVHLQRSWIVLSVFATLMMPLFIFATPMLKALGQDEIIAEEAGKIALWYIPVVYSVIFSLSCGAYLHAQSKSNIILGFFAPFSIHVFFLWLLTMKYEYGVTGVLVSILIADLFMSISQVIFIISGGCPETWKGFSTLAFHDLGAVIKLSLSSGAMLCLKLLYHAVITILAGNLKNAKVAIDALAICLRISGIQMMVSPDLLAKKSIENMVRKGDPKAAKLFVGKILLVSLAFGTELIIGVVFIRDPLVSMFTKDHDVAVKIAHLSTLLVISILLNSVEPVVSGVAVAVGWQTTVGCVNPVCNYLFGVIFGAVLGYTFNLQVQGIWSGMIFSTFVQTIILIVLILKTDWDEQVSKCSNDTNQMVGGVELDDQITNG